MAAPRALSLLTRIRPFAFEYISIAVCFSLQQCPELMKILMFELRFFLESYFLDVLLNVPRQCFAKNGGFVGHCPMFYMILVGSFHLEVFYDSIPSVP